MNGGVEEVALLSDGSFKNDQSVRRQGFEFPSKLGSPCVTPRDGLSKVQGLRRAGMGFRSDLPEQAEQGLEPPRMQKEVGMGVGGSRTHSFPSHRPDPQR